VIQDQPPLIGLHTIWSNSLWRAGSECIRIFPSPKCGNHSVPVRQGALVGAYAVVERLRHDFADLGPLETHVIDGGVKAANATADALAERLQGDLLL
jgi:hypothetical protein